MNTLLLTCAMFSVIILTILGTCWYMHHVMQAQQPHDTQSRGPIIAQVLQYEFGVEARLIPGCEHSYVFVFPSHYTREQCEALRGPMNKRIGELMGGGTL